MSELDSDHNSTSRRPLWSRREALESPSLRVLFVAIHRRESQFAVEAPFRRKKAQATERNIKPSTTSPCSDPQVSMFHAPLWLSRTRKSRLRGLIKLSDPTFSKLHKWSLDLWLIAILVQIFPNVRISFQFVPNFEKCFFNPCYMDNCNISCKEKAHKYREARICTCELMKILYMCNNYLDLSNIYIIYIYMYTCTL